jgi:hypothetical protein
MAAGEHALIDREITPLACEVIDQPASALSAKRDG